VTGTALVTGAAGFVGRHFTTHLREQGWGVDAVDTAYAPWLTDRIDALEFFSWAESSYDLVLHCAAVVGGRQVIDHQPLAQAVNLELDAALFRWALRARPGRVVYFSSSAVYPVDYQRAGTFNRLREDLVDGQLGGPTAGVPDQLYGWAKLTGEHLACRARDEGVAVTVVRPFSGYGEDQDDCYPFPAFVDRALRREDPFLIWGNGSQVRDFIHIDDIVATTMELVHRGANGPLNLGSGVGVSMRRLAQMICRQAGYAPAFETVPTAPAGVFYRVASVEKLFAIGPPRVSLDQGIQRALKAREVARARTGTV
jgi:nucleoside-diphosphate-sugar epimerase